MGSLIFEPTEKDYEFVEALLEGLNGFAKKLSATQETEEDKCLSCPYWNSETPDFCNYPPDGCYLIEDDDDYDGPDPCELEKSASWRFGSIEEYMEADMEGYI